MLKSLILALAALPLISARPFPEETALHYPLVHQVRCDKSRGTAFRIGPNQMISVAHVTMNSGCKIGGEAFESMEAPKLDFATITVARHKIDAMPINCDGFQPGEWYFATGYAYGNEWQTTVRLFATLNKDGGMRVLRGEAIRGMSGGPIMNAKGEAVGTVNAKHIFMPLTYSVELKDTSVCA